MRIVNKDMHPIKRTAMCTAQIPLASEMTGWITCTGTLVFQNSDVSLTLSHSGPLTFPHKCDECNTVEHLDRIYPFVDFI